MEVLMIICAFLFCAALVSMFLILFGYVFVFVYFAIDYLFIRLKINYKLWKRK